MEHLQILCGACTESRPLGFEAGVVNHSTTTFTFNVYCIKQPCALHVLATGFGFKGIDGNML